MKNSIIEKLIEEHVRKHFKEDEKAKNFEITFVSVYSITATPESGLDFYSGDVFKITSSGSITIRATESFREEFFGFNTYKMTIRHNREFRKLEILDKGKLASPLSLIVAPIILNFQK
jgi:hypothetical protein